MSNLGGSNSNLIKGPPGLDALKAQQAGNSAKGKLPWDAAGETGTFFKPVTIEADRWDRLYPYRLLVIDVTKNNQVVSKAGSVAQTSEQLPGGGLSIAFTSFGGSWEFRLPIAPQQFSISTPYAIETQATLRGIVEEHNGVKFKMITCAGTMGIWPFRPSADPGASGNAGARVQAEMALGNFGSSTIAAGSAVANSAQALQRLISGGRAAAPPKTIKPVDTPQGLESTGYYHAMILDQFLEQYSEAKRNPNNAGWRLVFDIPKQNQSFIVTPMIFDWSQSVESPAEIRYRMQFKAWRRVSLASVDASPPPSLPKLSPSVLQTALNSITQARRTLAGAYSLVRAVRSDFRAPFSALRETALFVKGLAGLPAAAADLPSQVISDASAAISDSLATLDAAAFQALATDDATKAKLQQLSQSRSNREGLGVNAIRNGQGGAANRSALNVDPSQDIFANPEQNFDILNALNIDELPLNEVQREALNNETDKTDFFSVDDLRQRRTVILDLALQISNAYGAGDDTYNAIYGKPAKRNRVQEMTIDEYAVLKSLYDVVQSYDSLTATNEIDAGQAATAMQYVGALAQASQIPFNDSLAKIRLPVPFGLNIEQIAMRYLGNPDRYVEIATLNALRSPYIDETGFEYPLLSNASGRQANVAQATNLFVGQRVSFVSNSQPRRFKRITNIEKINETNWLLTLDGLADLGTYTLTDRARLKAFLPGTTNSEDQIFVPSDLPADDTVLSRAVPAVQGDPLVGLSKIDWLLTDAGDVATDNYGDFRLAAGMANIIQALRLKFITPPGRLIKHPGFGAGLQAGVSNADLNAGDVYKAIKTAIELDPRFGPLQRLEIRAEGPRLSVSLSVQLANGQGVFPIAFVLGS